MAAPLPVLINRSGGTASSLGDELEQTAHGHGLDLQVLYAHQPEAWAATLAIGICPGRAWGS
jgi:hypothetical protein